MKELERTIRADACFQERIPDAWQCDRDAMLTVRMTSARSLLDPGRLDLICKLYYIECREKNRDMTFARKLYAEHIRALWKGRHEGTAVDLTRCMERFDRLIDAIRQHGYDPDKGVIAVNEEGVLLDGAHRAAIAIYFDLVIPVATIRGAGQWVNHAYLSQCGLEQKYLDFMVYRYITWKRGTGVYLFCLWPVADQPEKLAVVEKQLREISTIICRKEIDLNYLGLKQFMVHLYRGESWSGSMDNGYRGIPDKAICCYRRNARTTVYFIENVTHERVLALKQWTRDFYHLDIHSTHSSDTSMEAIDAARMLLNQNSIHLLNHGSPFSFRGHMKKYVQVRTDENQAVASTLALYGIQNAQKIRIVEDERITLNPENHLYYLGVRVPALSCDMIHNRWLRLRAMGLACRNRLLLRTAPPVRMGIKGAKDTVRKLRQKARCMALRGLKRTSAGKRILSMYREVRYGRK